MKNRFINKVLTAVFFITASLSVWAEPLPTPSPSNFPFNPNGGQDEPAEAPIDQITIWLLATGVLLVAYYLMKFKSKIETKA